MFGFIDILIEILNRDMEIVISDNVSTDDVYNKDTLNIFAE